MSPRIDWATIAVSGYIREDGRPRVVIPLVVGDALVVDQHDEAACHLLGIDRELSNAPWRPPLADGAEPRPGGTPTPREQRAPMGSSTDRA